MPPSVLRCLSCRSPLATSATCLSCPACGATYPIAGRGRPVMTRADHPLFPHDAYRTNDGGARMPTPAGGIARAIRSIASVNLSRRRCLARIGRALARQERSRVLLVGAGSQAGDIAAALRDLGVALELVATDVSRTAAVDVYCDAQELPFADASFDAVIATAVLEHVAAPWQAAAEFSRVLRPGGWVYSEIPFMQQVHEGAYDFTRFSLSGHRRLFREFAEADAGVTAGPWTGLAWSIEHLLLACIPLKWARPALKALVRITCAIPNQLDRVLGSSPAAEDGASCTYFLGTRKLDAADDGEIVRRYSGAQS